MIEVWKDIKGFEGRYQISNNAEVKSLARSYYAKSKKTKMFVMERILKPFKDKNGYLVVNLKIEQKSHIRKIHRLVAEYFIENNTNMPTVNHKNGIKTDNSLENLEWVSFAENNRHRTINLLSKPKLSETAILDILKNCKKGTNKVNRENSISSFAAKYGVTRATVSDILNKKKLYTAHFEKSAYNLHITLFFCAYHLLC